MTRSTIANNKTDDNASEWREVVGKETSCKGTEEDREERLDFGPDGFTLWFYDNEPEIAVRMPCQAFRPSVPAR